MKGEFDWEISKEGSWSDTGEGIVSTTSPRNKRRSLRWLAIGLAITLVAMMGVYWRLQARANELEAAARQSVAASYGLMRQAEAQGDLDLFQSLRADEFARGTLNALDEMISQGIFFGRAYVGLRDEGSPEIASVDFTPDLQRATLTGKQRYSLANNDLASETVVFEHTTSFQFAGGSWLLSEASEEFWGRWLTYASENADFKLFYTERDSDLVERLAPELEGFLREFCDRLENAPLAKRKCPKGRPITVSLRPELESLLELAKKRQPMINFYDRLVFHLPSPTLLGVPTDEPGYQVLYRIYAANLADGLWQVLGRDLAQRDVTIREEMLLARLLVELGVKAWPPAGPAERNLSAMLDHPPPQAALLCLDEALSAVNLLGYDARSERWSQLQDQGTFLRLFELSGQGQLLLQSATADETGSTNRLALFIYQNGLITPVPPLPYDGSSDLQPGLSTAGNHLVVRGYNANADEYQSHILELSACPGGSCRWRVLPGLPIWSPDGSRMIVVGPDAGRLRLGDATGENLVELAPGWSPVWLSDDMFAFLRAHEDEPIFDWQMAWKELIVADGSGDAQRSVISTDILSAYLLKHREEPIGALTIMPEYLVPVDDRRLLFLAAAAYPPPGGNQAYRVFEIVVDVETGDFTEQDASQMPLQWAWAPGGRFLSTTRPASDGLNLELNWTDTSNDKSGMLVFSDASRSPDLTTTWSADGQWLLALHDGILWLIHPETGSVKRVVPELSACFSAAWMN